MTELKDTKAETLEDRSQDSDENLGYTQTKEQLDVIVKEVRRKDVSLEKSLDLLEEGVRLANRCTELIDQAAWDDVAVGDSDGDAEDDVSNEDGDDSSVKDDAGDSSEKEADVSS